MFNQRLRAARKARGYKLQQMADMLDISLRAYQHYEQAERSPSFDVLIRIADILDVSIDWLMGRDEWLKSHGVSVDELL